MGTIVSTPRGSEVHGEARRESFDVYTEFGKQSIELGYDQLDHMIEVLLRIRLIAVKSGDLKPRPREDDVLRERVQELEAELSRQDDVRDALNEIAADADVLRAKARAALEKLPTKPQVEP